MNKLLDAYVDAVNARLDREELERRRLRALPDILADLLDQAGACATDLMRKAEIHEDSEAVTVYRPMRSMLADFLADHKQIQERISRPVEYQEVKDEDLPF